MFIRMRRPKLCQRGSGGSSPLTRRHNRTCPVAQPPAKMRQTSIDAALTGEGALGERCESAMDDASLRDLVAREAASVGVDEKLALTILSLESNDGADSKFTQGRARPHAADAGHSGPIWRSRHMQSG